MVLMTSMLTGIFAALLRSAFGVILVAFIVSVISLIGLLAYGASLLTVALTIASFNLGLILMAAGAVIGAGVKRA